MESNAERERERRFFSSTPSTSRKEKHDPSTHQQTRENT
jgi:hypothetical protein